MSEPGLSPYLEASFGDLRIADAMHEGIVSCPPDTPLRAVARMLASYRVHAMVVYPRRAGDLAHVLSWRAVSDLDVARAAREGDLDELTAGEIAVTPVCCMTPGESLAGAVETMIAYRLWHVFVIDEHTQRPIGVLSTLDVARALAGLSSPRELR